MLEEIKFTEVDNHKLVKCFTFNYNYIIYSKVNSELYNAKYSETLVRFSEGLEKTFYVR